MVDHAEETVPSLPPAESFLDTVAGYFERPEEMKPLLQDIMQRAFHERVGGQDILRTNAIAYHLRELQLAGQIPTDPESLKTYLEACQIGIVDVGNLKRTNEDQTIGGSTAAGDQAIALHAQSLSAAVGEKGMVATFRQQGDEFLVLIHPNQPMTTAEMVRNIEAATRAHIQAIASDPQNPLHQIARDHPELLTKTMSFTTLHNVALPLKTQRHLSSVPETEHDV